MGSFVGAALRCARDFLLEPETAGATPPGHSGVRGAAGGPPRSAPPGSLEVVVVGLSARCGVSTLARGLAASLALPGARGAHVLAVGRTARAQRAPGPALAGACCLWELPPALRDPEQVAQWGSTVARLAGSPAALVWDVPAAECEHAALAAKAADTVVLVAHGGGEPALGELVAQMAAERFGRVLLVANRPGDSPGWSGRAAVCVPRSRIGALLARRCRRPGGAFGLALDELAAAAEQGA